VSEGEAPEPDLRPPRDSFWTLIPRRSVMSVVVLLLILVAVIVLRQRAGSLARGFGEALLGTPPKGAPARREQPPRVRLAPVKEP
jgi:hypothetical protein